MKTSFISFFVVVFLWLLPPMQSHSQCLSAPTAVCNSTGPLATDGETINDGTTKWYYGPVVVFNQLNLNGGTLIVCGDLTIDKFYMDSGKIFVQPGGRLVIGNGIGAGLVLRGNSYLYNYGILEIRRNLSLENGWASAAKPNIVINATVAAEFKMNNQYFVINNTDSRFVNMGKAYFHGLITDPQASMGSVCLGKSSETVMNSLYNKVKNSYIASEAYACVSVSNFSQLWDTLCTINPNIRVCLGPVHRTDSTCLPFGCKPNWGMADVLRGCQGCVSIQTLTNRFISFAALPFPSVRLYWEMESYRGAGIYVIEASVNGSEFQPVHTMAAVENSKNYWYYDASPLAGREYYRVKYTDTLTNFVIWSPVARVHKEQSQSVLIYPNPFTDRLWLSLPGNHSAVSAVVTNMYGAVISRQQLSRVNDQWQLSLPAHYPAGIYQLTIMAGEFTWKQKILKQSHN
jgi:hypothetical protein